MRKEISVGYVVKFRVDGGEKDHAAKCLPPKENVDQVTRTLKIKSIVKESHRELLPGVFAKVDLQMGNVSNADDGAHPSGDSAGQR